MSEDNRQGDSLPPSLLAHVDSICDRFEDAWQAGQRPRLVDFLAGAKEVMRPTLLHELLRLLAEYLPQEQRRRWQQGERVRLRDYLHQTPELHEEPECIFELICDEVLLREQCNDTPPGPEDYLDLLPAHEVRLRAFFADRRARQQATQNGSSGQATLQRPSPAETLAGTARPEEPAAPPLDRYQTVRFIGRGGMGDVFWVHDPQLGRDLAIKVLRQDRRQPHLVQRFLGEARLHSGLQHPSVVPVHELGQTLDGRPFFTMKLINGHTLDELLRERAGPAEQLPRFLGIFEQVCQALAYAHAQGVIHRDLKPGNVMVGAFGEVQVMDWGLAKLLCQLSVAAPVDPETVAPAALEDTLDAVWGTQPGEIMGTLAYMPPEQARGEAERVDERSDVFGLGAMLCEILTGRPPFTGAGWSEVLEKARACDRTEALARLDSCGADVELVQMAKGCLAVEPGDRPPNAGTVAQEVAAYLAGAQERLQAAERERAAAKARAEEAEKTAAAEQARAEEARKRAAAEQARAEEAERAAVAEQARAEEAKQKMAAERKARRRTMWLATAVLLFGFLGGGWGLWWRWQRAELVRTTDADLAEVRDDMEKWKIADAHKAMERAEGRVAGGGPADLLQRVGRMRDALTLAKRLENIRQKSAMVAEGMFVPNTREDRDYATLFADFGLAVEGEDVEVAVARIRGSVIKAQLVAALDDWAGLTANPRRRAWLLEVGRRAEPGEWSDRFRDPAVWEKPAVLEQLAREVNIAELSPQLLSALGDALIRTKANAVPLLKAAQQHHPNDFWLNFQLGHLISEEAVGYYRAALAVQPDSSAVHNNLGNALHKKGRLDEAIEEYRKAIALDDKYAMAHYNLGLALQKKGRLDEAIKEYRRAIAIDDKYADAHNNLGAALAAKGRLEEAIEEHRKAIAIDDKFAMAHSNLGNALADKGRLDEAIEEYRRAIDIDDKYAKAHGALGQVLLRQGRFTEARKAIRQCLELLPANDPLRPYAAQLVQHCEEMLALDAKLPSILKDKAKPTDIAERIGFAVLCQQYKHLYTASARFYAKAFAEQPRLAEDLTAGIRYNAACAAALAAAGKGKDADQLSGKERARLRKQALDWLRADLQVRQGQLKSWWPGRADEARQALKHWQQDPSFAGLREKHAVDTLPQAERDACRKLWADVAALLKRTQEK